MTYVRTLSYHKLISHTVADPDLELRRGARFFRDVKTKLICEHRLPCRLFFLLRFFIILFIYLFFAKIRGGRSPRAPPLDPPLPYLISTLLISVEWNERKGYQRLCGRYPPRARPDHKNPLNRNSCYLNCNELVSDSHNL